MIDRLNAYAPIALAALRIIAGLLFLESGMQKLFGFPPAPFEIPMNACSTLPVFWNLSAAPC